MGSPWNGLMRRNPPNKYSMKKIDMLNTELPERIKLIERCGGTLRFHDETVKRKDGAVFIIRRVDCMGGTCECGCERSVPPNLCLLHPHENPRRSNGGKVSLKQSIMVLNECHAKLDGRNPKLEWIKETE